MLSVYLWSLLGALVINMTLIWVEEEFLEYFSARILQWSLNLILSLLFFQATLGYLNFFVALLHQMFFAGILFLASMALPYLMEEFLGYGNTDEMAFNPWFLLVSLVLSLLWGGLPELIALPGFRLIWQQYPGFLIFFFVGQISICLFTIFLQEYFEEQSFLSNTVGALLSVIFTLSIAFALQERLHTQGLDLFLVSFLLVITSFLLWVMIPLISESTLEYGKLDLQMVKLGCAYTLIAFLIAGISASFSWFEAAGNWLNQWFHYFGF